MAAWNPPPDGGLLSSEHNNQSSNGMSAIQPLLPAPRLGPGHSMALVYDVRVASRPYRGSPTKALGRCLRSSQRAPPASTPLCFSKFSPWAPGRREEHTQLPGAAQDYLRKVPPPLSTVQVSLCLHLEHQRGPAHLYPVPASVAACWAAYAPAPSRRPALYLPVSAPGLLGSSQAVSRVIVTTSPTHNPRHSAIGRKFQRIVNDSMEC
ncbi:hypothetical protein V8E51_004662 [Hyaloscypha variabilis]|uniref:Uncharacterized protein n=1 Tax=Hyaloscypha variabilis (strain UAMH 11265 / GT02V1 / F) TaxID=1149755 RepID=A0A2J6RDS2_HYAVF|nr:hypothetical protein L207DRAFT_532266 [Hyaloscypha variabilis F]